VIAGAFPGGERITTYYYFAADLKPGDLMTQVSFAAAPTRQDGTQLELLDAKGTQRPQLEPLHHGRPRCRERGEAPSRSTAPTAMSSAWAWLAPKAPDSRSRSSGSANKDELIDLQAMKYRKAAARPPAFRAFVTINPRAPATT
jgi:hypothetical protein